MYFIIDKNLAVWESAEISGTLRDKAKTGELTVIDVSAMKYLNRRGEWARVDHWLHPFVNGSEI